MLMTSIAASREPPRLLAHHILVHGPGLRRRSIPLELTSPLLSADCERLGESQFDRQQSERCRFRDGTRYRHRKIMQRRNQSIRPDHHWKIPLKMPLRYSE
jgi:hypothetical protein